MKRRSIFKLFVGAVMAAAMDVCGLELPKPFSTITYKGEFKWKNISENIEFLHPPSSDYWRVLMSSGYEFPTGMGNNRQAIT